MTPDHSPLQRTVRQQARGWIAAGVFEAMVHDVREMLRVTGADTLDPATAKALPKDAKKAAGRSVTPACVDQGYTAERHGRDAKQHGIELSVVTLPEAKRGFVLNNLLSGAR